MGCRPPLQGSGLSGWTLPARALAVGGEERVPPGTLAGAVVEAPGQVTADLPTAHQRRDAPLGPVAALLEVDVDAVRTRDHTPLRGRPPGGAGCPIQEVG